MAAKKKAFVPYGKSAKKEMDKPCKKCKKMGSKCKC
jgi:hypothetical protein